MKYEERHFDNELKNFLACYWKFEIPETFSTASAKTMIPDGCASLVYHTNNKMNDWWLRFAGPRTKNLTVPVLPGSTYYGLRFLPGSIGSFFYVNGILLRDKFIDANYLIDPESARLLINGLKLSFEKPSVIENLLLNLLQTRNFVNDRIIGAVVDQIIASEGKAKINDLIKNSSLSERQIQRKFKSAVGLTLKEFARIRRIYSVAIKLFVEQKISLEAILGGGYFDQSHFSKEFFNTVGLSANQFKKMIKYIHEDSPADTNSSRTSNNKIKECRIITIQESDRIITS